MVTHRNIDDFVNFHYIPFCKAQCVRRILAIWVIGLAISVLGLHNRNWLAIIICVNAMITLAFSYLVIKAGANRKSRFLCDGIYYAYLSVLLCIAAYRVISLQIGENKILLILLLGLWSICILLFALIVFLHIKHGRYRNPPQVQKEIIFPFFGGIIGIAVAKFYLRGTSQETMFLILSVVLLLLSFLVGIGSLNLLKFILAMKQE